MARSLCKPDIRSHLSDLTLSTFTHHQRLLLLKPPNLKIIPAPLADHHLHRSTGHLGLPGGLLQQQRLPRHRWGLQAEDPDRLGGERVDGLFQQ